MIMLCVLEEIKNNRKYFFKCLCKCGNIKIINKYRITDASTKSCGCFRKQYMKQKQTSHGGARTRLYQTYKHMMERCYKEDDQAYHNYGGRGINVCEKWNYYLLGYEIAFNNFKEWALSNRYSDNLTIDRIDNNGNYCPENCRWISSKEQASNRRGNILYTYNNITKTIKQWSEDPTCVVSYETLRHRLKSEWPMEKALRIPASLSNKKSNI